MGEKSLVEEKMFERHFFENVKQGVFFLITNKLNFKSIGSS